MKLKHTYSSREVASLTGLTARQLQLWDEGGLVAAAIPSHKTDAGGHTERRYTPIELFELLVLADLRRRGFSVHQLHLILKTLREQFSARLFDATGGGGNVQLLTDGRDIYARTERGEFFNLLQDTDAAAAGGRERRVAEGAELDAAAARNARGALADRENLFEVVGRTRNDVHADELADAAGGGGAGIGRGLHRADVAAHDRRHEARVDFLPADEHDVGRLAHRVGGFDHADEAARLDHAERVADLAFGLVLLSLVFSAAMWAPFYANSPGNLAALIVVAGKDRARVADAEVPHDDLAEDVAEVGRHREIAAFVALLDRQAGPAAVDLAAADAAADRHHRVAVSVIGAAVAVLPHRPSELRHRQHDGVGHAVAEVGDERGDAAREVVEARGELALRRALVDVRVPAADVRERDLEADVGLDELRDLLQRLAERRARIVGAVLRLILAPGRRS